jgi:hypothetical protein
LIHFYKLAQKKQPFTSELLTKKTEEIKLTNNKLCDAMTVKEKLSSKVQNLDVLGKKYAKIGIF